MTFEFRLPDLGEGMDSGEIVEWLVTVGDFVREDDRLVEIQTDKAIVELPSPHTGTVLSLGGKAGDTVPVGEIIAVIGEPEESPAMAPPGPVTATKPAPPAVPSAAAPQPAVTDDAPPVTSASHAAAPRPAPASTAGSPISRPLASPAVRGAAREMGIDLVTITGSGPGGRIVREDLDRAAGGEQGADATAPAPHTAPSRADEVVPLRGTRRVIARNMTLSWQTIPHIIDFREADTTALTEMRKALQARAEQAGQARLTMMPLLAKIAATVVRHHPSLNASLDDDREEITYHAAVHLSVAISAPGGLVTPVIRDADSKSVLQLAEEMAALTAAARGRHLTPAQLDGGTFTVNNYGALGSPLSTPIIRPGQAANLGFGRVTDKAVVREGQIVARPMMGISCSGDHRIMDGEHLASFCNDLIAAIENPLLLLAELA